MSGTTAGDTDRSVQCKNNEVFNDSILFCFKLLDKRAIQELIKQVDPMMQIDEEVEDV